jgi:hypothetical protein
MRYMLLIYGQEGDRSKMSLDELGQMRTEYGQLTETLKQSGAYVAGDGLEASSTATTVRVRSGKIQSTDGPFAETREQLGGYYLVEASDLDEAIAIAARIPGARSGSIEVRPVMSIPGATSGPKQEPQRATAAR